MLRKWHVLVSIITAVSVITVLSISAEESLIPSWIKNTAGFWVKDQISDKEFISALQWLIDNGILTVSQKDTSPDTWNSGLQVQSTNTEKPPPVEIGFECQDSWPDPNKQDDYGSRDYTITVQNFENKSHSAVIEVLDLTDGGNKINSKSIEVQLAPNEIKKVTENIVLTALSNFHCNVNLVSVK